MFKKIKKVLNNIKQELKHLNKVVKYCTKKSNKNYILILIDVLLSKIIYLMSIEEYKKFEFYNIKHPLRKTYLTKFKHDILKRRFYKKDILSIIKNKEKFIQRFNKYIKRDIKNIKNISFKEFENILTENKKIICRSINSDFTSSYKIYDLTKFRGPGFILENAKNNKLYLVEKYFPQHKKLNEITNNLVIINIVTMIDNNKVDIISSYITFKENDLIIKGYIDIKKSHIKGHLRNENNEIYEEKIVNYEIPFLDKIIDYVKILAKEIEEIKEVEWSICLDSKGKIHLMDATTWKNYIFAQTPEHLNKKIGLFPYYKKIVFKK